MRARPIDEEESMSSRMVGINHVALEVDDLERSLDFYGGLFELRLRGRAAGAAFVDIGDQFLALMQGRSGGPDATRHFGLVVDDKEAVRASLAATGAKVLPGRRLDFLDPDGNRVEIVQYDGIQFTKPPHVLRGMGLELGKTEAALAELRAKGLAE
jgi:catechol 2,3-dioxygenase-like lactoylglutathione lyase family enzyme